MSTQQDHIIPNTLKSAYRALRSTSRFLEGSHKSPYEEFYAKLSETLSPQKRLDVTTSNAEVEAFYLGRQSEGDFLSMVENKILSKVSLQNTDLALLLNVVWETCSSLPKNAGLFSKFSRLSGRELWELFIRLDSAGQMELQVDDVCDIIVRIFKANGHSESEDNIREWFYPETQVDFWSFLRTIVYSYVGLLQVDIVHELYGAVTSEVLMEGQLEKKGHVVHNWKSRWFVLTQNALIYFESQDTMLKKRMITINGNSQANAMAETKGHQFRFRVVDGATGVVTEISAPDYGTMKGWLNTIKTAIRMHKVNGRNFLHCLRLAKEGFPSASASVAVTSHLSPLPSQPPRALTSPTHRALATSVSVPVESQTTRSNMPLPPRSNMPLPPPPVDETRKNPNMLRPQYDRSTACPPVPSNGKTRFDASSGSMNDAPPLPPQRFDQGDTASLKQGVVLKVKKPYTTDAESPGEQNVTTAKRIRRSSSLTDFKKVPEQQVRHIKKGRDDYAIVAMKKKSSLPDNHEQLENVATGQRRLPEIPNSLEISDSRPPPTQASSNAQPGRTDAQFNAREKLESRVKQRMGKDSAPSPPQQKQKGYATLDFNNGAPEEAQPEGKASMRITEELPKDVKTKFAYSTVVFNKDDQDKETAQQLKKNRPQPPPPVKYDPSAKKKISTYSSESDFTSPTARIPIRKVSLPEKIRDGYNVDYADIDFNGLAPVPTPRAAPPPLPDKDPPPPTSSGQPPPPTSGGQPPPPTSGGQPPLPYKRMKAVKVRPQPPSPLHVTPEEEESRYVNVRTQPPNQPPRVLPRRTTPVSTEIPPLPPRKIS